jgi:hypothetical protein
MTARIQRSFELQMGVHFTGVFYMNIYDIDLHFNVETENIKEQNIALERIKFYLAECLEYSIFVYDKEEDAIEKYMSANLKVSVLPEEPYDQIVAIMLMTKLNAITEGRLVITDISISSRMSDGVSCMHDIDDNMGPFILKDWWSEGNTKINSYKYSPKNKKILKLTKLVEWSDVYLNWDNTDEPIVQNIANEIVYVNFDNKTGK